jgi:MFS family permease
MVRFLTLAEGRSMTQKQKPWYREMRGYHWWILCVATMGWMFDTMDQRLFVLSRERALEELLDLPSETEEQQKEAKATVKFYGGIATALLLIGWATGGLIFGVIGDRWGRAKTMFLAIFVYSLFTGLSSIALSWWDFALYRFLTGLGVGGEFAAGVALVAEVMPNRARPHALGLLQAMSAIGNIVGSLLGLVLLPMTLAFGIRALGIEQFAGWRLMFVAGVVPALIFVFLMRTVREPDTWVAAKEAATRAAREGHQVAPGQELGSLSELMGNRRWRYNAIIGISLATAGAIGLWGVGFWTPELIRDILGKHQVLKETQDRITSIALALQDVGAFFGILAFTWVTARLGRRGAFAAAFLIPLCVTVLAFGWMDQPWQVYWVIPLIGFSTLAVFGGYAIYFPELFPTRLRSTGVGFCYNVARYLAAAGPFLLGALASLYQSFQIETPFRWAAMTVASVYVLGLLVVPFAPETKGRPLPE